MIKLRANQLLANHKELHISIARTNPDIKILNVPSANKKSLNVFCSVLCGQGWIWLGWTPLTKKVRWPKMTGGCLKWLGDATGHLLQPPKVRRPLEISFLARVPYKI
jgi:hypothetical protein